MIAQPLEMSVIGSSVGHSFHHLLPFLRLEFVDLHAAIELGQPLSAHVLPPVLSLAIRCRDSR
jgi:hypothetical protein